MGGFELIDHTADVGILATGKDLQEAFAYAAQGMFSVIVELEDVAEEASIAYKDVANVIRVTHNAGLSRQVARMRPIGVIKG